MPTTYTISELSREFDITARAIRFYEDQGLLAPSREGAGGRNRVYTARDRTHLKLTLRGKRLLEAVVRVHDGQGILYYVLPSVIGKEGEYTAAPEFTRLGSGYAPVIEIEGSDPVPYRFTDCLVEMTVEA